MDPVSVLQWADYEIRIDLKASYTIASVFIINWYQDGQNDALRIGNSFIYVGDDGSYQSDRLTLATVDPIIEGGFIDLDQPVKGRYVVLRRIGAPNVANNDFAISEIKVYAVRNLIQYGATILKAPQPD